MWTSPAPVAPPDLAGLSSPDALRRFAKSGPNEIRREPPTTAFGLFVRQFSSPVIWLLLGASIVSLALGEAVDAAAIAVILAINAVIGFLQEHRAERALSALRSMSAPRARVRRDGRSMAIAARMVVPGDLLILEAGDVAAADARLVSAHALKANEAVLTGESVPVDKRVAPTPPETPLAERHDVVFMGTSIAAGTGLAEVTATGMRTELGRIAHLLATAVDTETPLQRRLAQVSETLMYLYGGIVCLVALAGLLRGWPWLQVFMAGVSLAVAAVPEGLPAVVTIALAVGVQRMAARHVLIRRLPAVETLGCATVICTDKTGTLTTGVMRVRDLWGPDHRNLLYAAAACCDAELSPDGRSGIGDPTELAILAAAAEQRIHRPYIERGAPRLAETPFDPVRKLMSIARADGWIYIKGAVESVLPLCSGGGELAEEANAQMAQRGLRVLAIAVAPTGHENAAELRGLIGIADPPRPEAIDAVAAARAAGITTVMITGDHPVTAHAIARELGILSQPGAVPLVHARATPEQKIAIVREWKARDAVVAMTGDGVNDAPALREAHIGIAMGRTGTDVTREASDMVLADDNFASIIAAVREGRAIFDNIRKTLVYLLTGNTAELAVMLSATVAGWPLPLLPLHLLWINVITDGLPALALVMDPPDEDVLRRPPRHPDEAMLGRREWRFIAAAGLVESCTVLGVFAWALAARGPLEEARSLAFSTLVLAELFRAFAARSTSRLLWEVGAFTNVRLLAVVGLSVLLQVGIHHIPAAQPLFEVGALSPVEWAVAGLAALIPVTALEIGKLVRRSVFDAPSSPPRRLAA